MAFSFGNTANTMGGSAAAGQNAQELETIQTEALGFLSIAGDAKVRLTSAWSPLPASTSSLLSVAPRKGLVAAAGPDHIILATTESVRKAFEAPKDGDSDIRAFEPQLRISMPMRVSQLAFTADENYLILSAESGGGLAAYEVQSLLQGSTNSAFELSTNGEPLRALVTNPTAEKAELCAIVTNGGNLHMANLKERKISGPLKGQVSCISWSSKGKQLCAGLADGTIHQMTPEGEGKAEIPRPSGMNDCHVSSLTWLENHLFLAIYRANNDPSASSVYRLITRQPPSSFTFQTLSDPVEPFGSDRTPHHSILRLRDFPPSLQDLLIVSSTASTEVGLLTRSQTPLANDKPAGSITGVFTTTELLDDTRRPTLPMTQETMEDSIPVGVALDLSSKEKVYRPIPSDEELEESPNPLPGFWILTHEGILCAWWLVYTDSVKQGKPYPGLAVIEGAGSAPSAAPAAAPASALSAPMTASPFASTGSSAFGSGASQAPTFGSSTSLGQKTSPWGAPAASSTPEKAGGAAAASTPFGTAGTSAPAFGKPSAIGFGQSSSLGARASPWASGAGSGGAAPSFGQSGFASFAQNSSAQSPFASAASNQTTPAAPASGGFAGFANKSGFSALSGNNSSSNTGSSPFGGGNASTSSPFGSGGSFGSSKETSAFGAKQDKPSGGVFGSGPFKLESSFKPDPAAKEDASKPATSGGSLFGSNFGSALNETARQPTVGTPPAKDEDMDAMESAEETPQAKPQTSLFASKTSPESTTPTTTPAPNKFTLSTTPATGTSIFGQPSSLGNSGGLFGSKSGASTTSGSGGLFGSKPTGASTASPFSSLFEKKSDPVKSVEPKDESETPKIKAEPIEDPPLPPDITSKATYPIGESSSSSATSNSTNPFAVSKPSSATPPSSLFQSKPTSTVKVNPFAPNPFSQTKASDVTPKASTNRPVKVEDAPLPPDPTKAAPKATPDAPLPPDPTGFKAPPSKADDAPLPPDFAPPKPFNPFLVPPVSVPDDQESGSEEDEDDSFSEGSGTDVAKDLSPTISASHGATPGLTPQSSFGGHRGTTQANAAAGQEQSKGLFGEISRNAPLFPRPSATSPRSPSPVRGAIPGRVLRTEATRSVSAPGMATQILRPSQSQSQLGAHGHMARGRQTEDSFLVQQRKLKARQEAEETQPLVDEEDDEVQKLLASEIEGKLFLDEFVAHTNVAPPAKESIPSQVEAVYRDINSMIDTFGLNLRSVKAFTKGHIENAKSGGRDADDLEDPDDWVLCEVDQLGEVIEDELYPNLEDGRVKDREGKTEACQDLARDIHRLRAKQEDLKRIIMARQDDDQIEAARSLPLSAEQAAQQNELRREFMNFSSLLAEVEKALIMLKTKIASASGQSGKGNTNVPTVEAIVRTITKMTSMAEKRSGDIDLLENQLRKVRLDSVSREGSPMVTPVSRRSVMSPRDSTPTRSFRHSISMASPGTFGRATPPRKKLSGYSQEEKGNLMDKRAKRQAVIDKLKASVEKKGVSVWTMEDIE